MVAALTTSDMKKLILNIFLKTWNTLHISDSSKSPRFRLIFLPEKTRTISIRGVGSYLKLGGQVVICGTQSVPSGWDMVNWSVKTWVGNCPPCPFISYTPVSMHCTTTYVHCTYVQSRYVDYWKRQMKNFPVTHPPYLLLSLFCFVFLSKGKIAPYHVQC